MSNITRYRGDTYDHDIQVFNTATRAPLDITGSTFKLSVSADREPTAAVYVFQITGVIEDALLGTVSFPLPEVDADNVGNFFYDIEMIDSLAEIQTIDFGSIIFNQDITK